VTELVYPAYEIVGVSLDTNGTITVEAATLIDGKEARGEARVPAEFVFDLAGGRDAFKRLTPFKRR
jgi:hypothetical protein